MLAPPCPAHPGHLMDAASIHPACQVSVGKDRIDLDYELSFGTVASLGQRQVMDRDGDGRLSREEQDAYLRDTPPAIAARVEVLLDDSPLPLSRGRERLALIDARVVPVPMRMGMRLSAALPPLAQGKHRFAVIDRSSWNNAAVADAPLHLRDPGMRLLGRSPEPTTSPDDPLRTAAIRDPLLFTVLVGDGTAPPETPATSPTAPAVPAVASDRSGALIQLVGRERIGPGILLAALVAAFALGAGHALEPGHGKTMVAAYLIGSRGTVIHAITLGLIVTLTHTAGVFVLGLVLLNAYQSFVPQSVVLWTGLASGLLVMLVGVWMILRSPAAAHRHHHHPHDHTHGHDHGHHHEGPPPPVGWGNLVSLGISGGLVPCPAALVVLLAALSLNRVALGLCLLLAFSAGLATVLIIIGILIVTAGRWLDRFEGIRHLGQALPRISGLVILILGAAIAAQALIAAGIVTVAM